MKNYLLPLLVCFVTVQSKSVPEPPSVPIGPFDMTANTTSPQGKEKGYEKEKLFQGDIQDPGRRTGGKIGEAGTRTPWPDAIIPYVFDCSVLSIESALKATKDAIKEWEDRTCVKFVEKQPHHKVYLEFIRAAGCWATYVGYKGKKTQISIGNGCDYKHVMVHELGHVIGFWHEQSRPDRDNYITINYGNVIRSLRYNFDIVREQTNNYGERYDFNSIMHYPFNAFAIDRRQNTIFAKDPRLQSSARPYRKLSNSDVIQTNRMYKCDEIKSARAKTMKAIGEANKINWASTGGKCQDQHQHCKSWAKANFCELSPDPMLTSCPESCGVCGKVCQDEYKDCPAWADYGYCIRKPGTSDHIIKFMLSSCRKSCAVCIPAPTTKPTTKPTTTLPPTTTPKPTTKPATRPPTKARPVATKPVTTQEPHTTTKVITKNGISIPSTKFTGVLCKDRSKYCKDWANDGRCDTDRWVYDNCLKSCRRYTVCDRYMIKPIGRCSNAHGVYSKEIIPDSRLYAPTTFAPGGGWYARASSARLYKEDDHRLKNVGAWCAEPNNNREKYLQIDFGSEKIITALATQGRDVYFEHVKAYSLSFRLGVSWVHYRERGSRDRKIFDANCDHVTPVMNLLERDVRARYMRIHPTKYIGAACLRVEVYGCNP
ncbi:zinc metallo ase nas-13-like [Paramuricea clavata]|uniref:Metalloendopeptidase n=1 Tax=Paramuricea clavata TaxID=317549 RepID=A0A6S7G9W0_PARCT|nr:zinc metallo ase nas-13-like [Paramuricea clavata]